MTEVKIAKKKGNSYDVTMKGFTAGMILAMKNALAAYPSPVAEDVKDFLDYAVEQNADLKIMIG